MKSIAKKSETEGTGIIGLKGQWVIGGMWKKCKARNVDKSIFKYKRILLYLLTLQK